MLGPSAATSTDMQASAVELGKDRTRSNVSAVSAENASSSSSLSSSSSDDTCFHDAPLEPALPPRVVTLECPSPRNPDHPLMPNEAQTLLPNSPLNAGQPAHDAYDHSDDSSDDEDDELYAQDILAQFEQVEPPPLLPLPPTEVDSPPPPPLPCSTPPQTPVCSPPPLGDVPTPILQTALADMEVESTLHMSTSRTTATIATHHHHKPKRQRIAEEILETERSYVNTLQDIQRLFLEPLRDSQPPILTSRQISELFSNIEDIIKVNVELSQQLSDRIANADEWQRKQECLGDIFLYLSPFLKIYSIYVKNYQSAIQAVMNWERKIPAFQQFLRDRLQLADCKGLTFQAYILTPVQRIPRYKLLLEDFLKHTPVEHPDHPTLTKALGLIESVALFVNEMIREQETVVKMIELQKSMSGLDEDLLVPGRKFLKQGELVKVCRKTNKGRVLFLFTDILIYAASSRSKATVSALTGNTSRGHLTTSTSSPIMNGRSGTPSTNITASSSTAFLSSSGNTSQSYKFHRKFDLLGMTVVNVEDNDLLRNCFQVCTPEKSFALFCRSPEEKQDWMRAIEDAIANLMKNRSTLKPDLSVDVGIATAVTKRILSVERAPEEDGDQSDDERPRAAPVWVPDNATLNCMQCGSEFSLLNRRHHCRACGRLVCGTCSPHRAVIPSRRSNNPRSSMLQPRSPLSPLSSSSPLITMERPVRVCGPCQHVIQSKLFYLKENLQRRSVMEMERPLSATPSSINKDLPAVPDVCKGNVEEEGEAGWKDRFLRVLSRPATAPVDVEQPSGENIRERLRSISSQSVPSLNNSVRGNRPVSPLGPGPLDPFRRQASSSIYVPTPFTVSLSSSHTSSTMSARPPLDLAAPIANDPSNGMPSPVPVPILERRNHNKMQSSSRPISMISCSYPESRGPLSADPSRIGIRALTKTLFFSSDTPIAEGTSPAEDDSVHGKPLFPSPISTSKSVIPTVPHAARPHARSHPLFPHPLRKMSLTTEEPPASTSQPGFHLLAQEMQTKLNLSRKMVNETPQEAPATVTPKRRIRSDSQELVTRDGVFEDEYEEDLRRDPNEVIFSGFLIKRGKRFKSWKMRFLVLTRSELQWFKPEEGHRPVVVGTTEDRRTSPHFLSSIPLHACVEAAYTVPGELVLPQLTAGTTSAWTIGSNSVSSLSAISYRDLLAVPDSPLADVEKLGSGEITIASSPFKLVSPSRTLYMIANTPEERDAWVLHLTKSVRDAWFRERERDKENSSSSQR